MRAVSISVACILTAMVASCGGVSELGGGGGGALREAPPVPDEPPGDFALALTVVPQGREGDASAGGASAPGKGGVGGARYVMEADWVLRAAVGPGVNEQTFPAQTRQLTHDQVQRLWWDLRDAGVLDAGRATVVRVEAVYVVSYTAAGARRSVAMGDEPGSRRLAERLGGLAWRGR